MSRALVLIACVACGGSPAPTQGPQAGPPAPLVATPAGADDVVVARVNGKPVYGSCVTIQAARGATKQQALQECIDFELLAQQAVAFATDPEVGLATRTALVSELVAREYEDKYDEPSDFGVFWDRIIERNKQRISHGEARASTYLRIPVAKDAPPEADAAAKAIAQEFAAAAKQERGLMTPHLRELAEQIIGTRATFEIAPVPPFLDEGGLVDEYARPLFAIPEVGRTSDAVRTPWGWDVILLTDLIPAEHLTPDEVIKTVMPDVQRSYFSLWTQQIAKDLGITPKLYDENLPLLEEIE